MQNLVADIERIGWLGQKSLIEQIIRSSLCSLVSHDENRSHYESYKCKYWTEYKYVELGGDTAASVFYTLDVVERRAAFDEFDASDRTDWVRGANNRARVRKRTVISGRALWTETLTGELAIIAHGALHTQIVAYVGFVVARLAQCALRRSVNKTLFAKVARLTRITAGRVAIGAFRTLHTCCLTSFTLVEPFLA